MQKTYNLKDNELKTVKYKCYDIDLAINDDYENYIIYDSIKGDYLENSPVFYTVDQAKNFIDETEKQYIDELHHKESLHNNPLKQHKHIELYFGMPSKTIYVVISEHNEYVTAFSTEELAQEFIKVNEYKGMLIVEQELK